MNLFVLTTLILCAGVLVATGLAVTVWSYRRAPGAKPMLALSAPVILWLLGSTAELWAQTLDWKVFWANFQYFGIVSVPIAYFMVALSVSRPEMRLSARLWISLLLIPAVSLLVLWTNPLHDLFRTSVQLTDVGSMRVLTATLGPYFWFHTTYSYFFILGGVFLLMRHALINRQRRPLQFILIALSALAPFAANLAYLVLDNRILPIDPTPLSILASILLITIVIVKMNYFDVIRQATSTFVNNMEDVMLVLDDESRILVASRSAERFFDISLAELRGQEVSQIAPEIHRHLTMTDVSLGVDCQVRLFQGGQPRDMDLRVTPIKTASGDGTSGCLITLRDISAVMLAEQRLSLAMQASRQGLWDLDMETGEIYYSPAWKRLLGYRNHELANARGLARKFTPSDQWQHLQMSVEKAIGAGEHWVETEFMMQHRDGHLVNILARTLLIWNSEGKLIRQVGTHMVMPKHN